MIELDRIYCEDCLDTLGKIDDISIDLIITSPPYNKGWWSPNKVHPSFTKCREIDYGPTFTDKMPPEEYERWQRSILNECLRVIKPTGSIWYNHMDILSRNRCIHPIYI